MSARAWSVAAVLVSGLLVCAGLWVRGSVTKGTAYRLVSGTNNVGGYAYEVRDRVQLRSLSWALLHPVAARRTRGEIYPVMSGVIGCLPAPPTLAAVSAAEAQFSQAIRFPMRLTVVRVAPLGAPQPDPNDAQMMRADCQALSRMDPGELTVPQVPAAS